MKFENMVNEDHSTDEKSYLAYGDHLKFVVNVIIYIVAVFATATFIKYDLFFAAGAAVILGSFAHVRWNKYCDMAYRISACALVYNSFNYNKVTIDEAKTFFETELDEGEQLYLRPALLRYIDEYESDVNDI